MSSETTSVEVTVLTTDERRTIAGRARTLIERVRSPAYDGPSVEEPERWVSEWEDRLPDDGDRAFETRIAAFGIDRDRAIDRLSTHGFPGDDLPTWTDDLSRLTTFVSGRGTNASPPPAVVDEAFADVLWPLATFAIEHFAGETLEAVPEPVTQDVLSALVLRLADLYQHTLFIEFKLYAARTDSDDSHPDKYAAFIDELLSDGLREFFLEYSLLARITMNVLAGFAESCTELFRRLRADAEEIQAELLDDVTLETLTGVEFTGDAHRQAEQVAILEFEDAKLVYKPRSVELGAQFGDITEWLDEEIADVTFDAVDFLPRDGYGWASYREPQTDSTERAAERYYRNAGGSICLLYVLGFTDGFLENVICSFDRPVVPDAETLVQPSRPSSHVLPSGGVNEALRGTVVETDLLPTVVEGSTLVGGAGFGSDELEVRSPNRKFTDPNTDAMEMEVQYRGTRTSSNLPRVNGETRYPSAYCDELIAGFTRTYEFLYRRRKELRKRILADFSLCRGRYLLRPTHRYSTIRKLLAEPKYQRTGLALGCKLEEFLAPFFSHGARETGEAVRRAEEAALLSFDVPRFTFRTDSKALELPTGRIDPFFAESGLGTILHRTSDLSPEDLDEQVEYLRLAYGWTSDDAERIRDERTIDATESRSLDSARLREHNFHLLRRVLEAMDTDRDGAPTWYLRRAGPDGGIDIRATDDGLYEGRLGIALYLSAFQTVYDVAGLSATIDRIVDSIDREPPETDEGIGGLGYGFTSVVYALHKLGQTTGEDRYTSIARSSMRRISQRNITASSKFDVLSGTAGVIHASLSLYEDVDDDEILRRARWAGDHLLDNVRTVEERVGWVHPDTGTVLTGFAHGNSGIATALYRLADVTNDPQYADVARNGLSTTETVYDPQLRNWADIRPDAERPFKDAWCYGRSGVGMAFSRIAASSTADGFGEAKLREALSGVSRLDPHDHVCCGNGSKIELLLRAGTRSNDARYRNLANAFVARMLGRKSPADRFETKWATDHWCDPTFFHGECGIGYTLLRLVNPRLPCVLAAE